MKLIFPGEIEICAYEAESKRQKCILNIQTLYIW